MRANNTETAEAFIRDNVTLLPNGKLLSQTLVEYFDYVTEGEVLFTPDDVLDIIEKAKQKIKEAKA